MSKHICRRTAIALELMIQNCLESQASIREAKAQGTWADKYGADGPVGKNYIKEFCTIKLGGPRRSGHTTAMCTLPQQYFKNPIFVFHNMSFGMACARVHGLAYNRVMSHQCFGLRARGMTADAIIVDMACFMSEKKREELYDMAAALAASQETFCIILLQ